MPYTTTYRGYQVRIEMTDSGSQAVISQRGERISVEPSSARARAVIDEWLNAR